MRLGSILFQRVSGKENRKCYLAPSTCALAVARRGTSSVTRHFSFFASNPPYLFHPPSHHTISRNKPDFRSSAAAHQRAVSSLVQFLTTQEIALSEGHRRGYLNLELRLLHHECCANLDNVGAKLSRPIQMTPDPLISAAGKAGGGPSGSGTGVYQAPLIPLDKGGLKKMGLTTMLNGPLKQSVLRQPLINATDSLGRARIMFGVSQGGTGGDADATARVITAIYAQMCNFYGQSYLFPIVESLGEMLNPSAPSTPPSLPFKEDSPPHDLGVDGPFWVGIERIHSAAKAFDRELWAEQRTGSVRVFEILVGSRNPTCLSQAKERRVRFFQELEERGEAAILRALDTLSVHIQWILVAGGESMLATGGSRLLHSVTGKGSVSEFMFVNDTSLHLRFAT